ncbi:MAG TPA: hypothetical protein IGR64_10505 [Leptolyngbyaceae cyanobacterium M65_K2018_010]|nr:hypothetical protein [Leptolyngbyaceae cyanobacterium M65_K2018_010]
MADSDFSPDRQELDRFLYPRSRYYGDFSPQNLTFNANLQDFAQRVSYISGLQTGGKLSCEDAYEKIKVLYQQLKQSKKNLGI